MPKLCLILAAWIVSKIILPILPSSTHALAYSYELVEFCIWLVRRMQQNFRDVMEKSKLWKDNYRELYIHVIVSFHKYLSNVLKVVYRIL